MQDHILITLITAVAAMASPVVIAWRKNPTWPSLAKVGVPVVVAAALAGVYLWLTGGFAGADPVGAFLAFYGLQQLAYSTILKQFTTLLEGPTDPPAEEPTEPIE